MIVFLINVILRSCVTLHSIGKFVSIMSLMVIFPTNLLYNHVSYFIKFFCISYPTVLWFRTKRFLERI
jgi:hypothetical protein